MSENGLLFEADELDTVYDVAMAGRAENDAARERMAKKRAAGRDLKIPAVKNPERRAACERDLERFCREYFGSLFYLALCVVHRDIIRQIQESILSGGRIALAAPRGFGKTTITLVAITWAIVYGHAKYIVLIGATKEEATERLDEIKEHFDGENALIAADFPEVCTPVIALGGASQKARLQTVNGKRTRLKWGEKRIMFARIADAPAAGTVMTVRGLDSSIRGLVRGEYRPDLVLIDDPQTDESAVSLHLTDKRDQILTRCVAGLVGPGRRMTIISLWTVIVKNDLADKYTSDKKPSYQSMRYKALSALPTRPELMEEYFLLRQDAMKKGDHKARSAHAWYLRRRDEIERGAVAIWQENFVTDLVSDEDMQAARESAFGEDDLAWAESQFGAGEDSPLRSEEVSAIQKALNFVADEGWDAFNSEYQNDPPEGENHNIVILDSLQVREKLSGYARGIVPEDAAAVVIGGDVGRYALHWTAQAVRANRRIAIIDYAEQPVNSPGGKVDLKTEAGKSIQLAITVAVLQALRSMRDYLSEHPYCKPDGTPVPVVMAMFDSRYAMPAVRAWADESGRAWQAIMGMGTKRGQKNWYLPKGVQTTPDGNLYTRQDNDGFWRYFANTDAYKRDVHAGFLLDHEAAGSIALFEPEDRTTHRTYVEHVIAEREEEVMGGGTRFVEVKGRRANHFFDATYNGLAAISFAEIFLPEIRLDAPEAVVTPNPLADSSAPEPPGTKPDNVSSRKQTKPKRRVRTSTAL